MKKMNKKGQILGVLFSLLVFIILWAMFFAKWLADWGETYIIMHSATGLEAFFMANMNLWVLGGLILGVVTTLFVGGRS